MDYESLLQLVRQRRSVRRFKPDAVSDEYVEKILDVARLAPSGNNSQPWEFIVVKKPEIRQKIAAKIRASYTVTYVREAERKRAPGEVGMVWTPHGYMSAQVFIILCGDTRMRASWAAGSASERVTQAINSSLTCAFVYMALAVTSLGLGCQWVSAIANPDNETFAKDLLGVPEELKFYAMLAIGYPDVKPAPRLVRPKPEMVQYDYFDRGKLRTAQQVKDFIAEHFRARAEEFKATYGHQADPRSEG
ncbi:MAG: nitroreductase family protein [Chloroflexi bacterium]|nr:nitroreductase family protein [Chloroflexota bacterium]